MYFFRITVSNIASQVYLKGNLIVYNPVVKLLFLMKILINYLQLKKEKLEKWKENMSRHAENHYSVVECVYMQ